MIKPPFKFVKKAPPTLVAADAAKFDESIAIANKDADNEIKKMEIQRQKYVDKKEQEELEYAALDEDDDESNGDDTDDESKPMSNPKTKGDKPSSAQSQLLHVCDKYLKLPNSSDNEHELEAKFGTRGIKQIDRMDFDNVVKKLISLGFHTTNERGDYSLKIQPEFLDAKTGEYKNSDGMERFRVDIAGMDAIQSYCMNNDLDLVNQTHSNRITMIRKMNVWENDKMIYSANFDDFNFRVSLKNEIMLKKTSPILRQVFENWSRSKKIFRYINRVEFVSKMYPGFRIDLSIVKASSSDARRRYTQTYNIADSNVFNNSETIEIEIEAINGVAHRQYASKELLANAMQRIVKFVLGGLQKSNYPISYPEQKTVLGDYIAVVFAEENEQNKNTNRNQRIFPSHFIGPGLVALQQKNIAPIQSQINVPNITDPYMYCVTDKADGDRHLMFINRAGRIYLIDMNMSVVFTGTTTTRQDIFESIFDGELILHNKNGNFINTFVAFDAYYISGIDVRHIPFMRAPIKDVKIFKNGTRLEKMNECIRVINPKGVGSSSPFVVKAKHFYPMFNEEDVPTTDSSIFDACNAILNGVRDGAYSYHVDGLIFTPTLLGVGSSQIGKAGPKRKIRWEHIFKWKPSTATDTFPTSYNTIDFLVFVKKDKNGQDAITPLFENGTNMHIVSQVKQYKTLELAVGFDANKHGYLNPCHDLMNDNFAPVSESRGQESYKPKRFYPTEPYDENAGMCNILLSRDEHGSLSMITEEGHVFGDQMVVEFRYDADKNGLWKWIPLRVRYDKTAEYQKGGRSFGNDYLTANNNWYSMHHPITEQMITTGENIPTIEVADDVYYNISGDRLTSSMRDFHNLFVKNHLILSACKKGDMLIDFGCGKGGDFPKWIAAQLSFVFGIDVKNDNIENRLNGACARFLNYKRENSATPWALFANGNAGLNIRSGTHMFNDKANHVVKTIFGDISADNSKQNVEPALKRQHAVASNGFDVSSSQFAMHYMFQSRQSFYNFIQNIAECTKLNGYFIATCFDGKAIFDLLKDKKTGESVDIYADEKKVWSVTKDYSVDEMPNDDSALGLQISVYQDSINQTIPEWLVNFEFFVDVMEKYGFVVVPRDTAIKMGLPNGSGGFVELFSQMEQEMKNVRGNPNSQTKYKQALQMKHYEKTISFLNRYCMFKKMRTINAEKLTRSILDKVPDNLEFSQVESALLAEKIQIHKKTEKQPAKPKIKRLAKKIVLEESPEAEPVSAKQGLQNKDEVSANNIGVAMQLVPIAQKKQKIAKDIKNKTAKPNAKKDKQPKPIVLAIDEDVEPPK